MGFWVGSDSLERLQWLSSEAVKRRDAFYSRESRNSPHTHQHHPFLSLSTTSSKISPCPAVSLNTINCIAANAFTYPSSPSLIFLSNGGWFHGESRITLRLYSLPSDQRRPASRVGIVGLARRPTPALALPDAQHRSVHSTPSPNYPSLAPLMGCELAWR